jgi:hypothetical protein
MNESDKKLEHEKHLSRLRAKKWRLLNKERHVEYTKQWKLDNPEKTAEYKRKYRHKTRQQERAQHSLYKALKSGKLRRPDTCELCGEIEKTEGHHPDYNNRLSVMWLCRACHVYIHEERMVANG